MAEAANKILKYRYLFPNPITDTDELVSVLNKPLIDYNRMPQKSLYGAAKRSTRRTKGAFTDL